MLNETIREILRKQEDAEFEGKGLVIANSVGTGKNDKPFWNFSVADKSGRLEAKVWAGKQWIDFRNEEKMLSITDPLENLLTQDLVGKVIGFHGKVTKYKGKNQYDFNKVFILDQNKHFSTEYVQRSEIPDEKLYADFRELIGFCEEPIAGFLKFVFDEKEGIWSDFKKLPAAYTIHHAYVAGLIEHTVSVAKTAYSMAQALENGTYRVNSSLVIAGALLHDLGKIKAYRYEEKKGMVPVVTIEGSFIDHIPLGYTLFESLSRDYNLDNKVRNAIAHIIVSHHGCKEYGSPALPATPEALVVSAADDLDFKMFCWKNAVNQLEDGEEISEINPFTQRRFWKWEQGNGA